MFQKEKLFQTLQFSLDFIKNYDFAIFIRTVHITFRLSAARRYWA